MSALPLERFEFATATALIDPDTEETDILAQEQAAADAAARDAAAEAAARQEAIVSALHSLAVATRDSQVAAASQLSAAVGQSVAAMLPSLAKSNFSAEVASATAALMSAGDLAKARLEVSPADETLVVEALRSRAMAAEIEVVADLEAPQGSAKLSWSNGGANFDVDTWVGNVQSLLDLQTNNPSDQEVAK